MPGDDPRHRGRERRRQVDADEDPLRRAAARRGHHHGQRARAALPVAPGRHRRSASAWCSSTSCWPTTSRCWRTSSSATSPARSVRLDIGAARKRIRELGRNYGLRGRSRRAGRPSSASARRQRVEILKVLYRGARILILDEPTAVLVPQEVDELFASLAELVARGRHRRLHLAQARRGAAGRRRHHRHPRRAHGGRGGARRGDRPRAGRADGRAASSPRPRPASRTVTDDVALDVDGLTRHRARAGRPLVATSSFDGPPGRDRGHRRRRGQRAGPS